MGKANIVHLPITNKLSLCKSFTLLNVYDVCIANQMGLAHTIHDGTSCDVEQVAHLTRFNR